MTLSISQIFPIESMHELMDKAETMRQEFVLAESLDRVWPVIADSDLVRRKLNMKVVDFSYLAVEEGGTILQGEVKVPFGTAHFFEGPFEWSFGHYNYGIRLYDKGPIRFMSAGFYLERVDDQHTKVTVLMKALVLGPFKKILMRAFLRNAKDLPQVIQDLVRNQQSEKPQPFEASLIREPQAEKRRRYSEALQVLRPFHPQILALADYASRASSRFLQRLRPYALADYYKLSRSETLAFFLEGTQVGVFALNWDVLCPSCRGVKKQSRSLRELEMNLHCEACGINFDVIDSKDVELTFAFAGELTVAAEQIYCAGNPGRSPSIHMQLPLAPGESRCLDLHLPGLAYRLRDLKRGHVARVIMDPNGALVLNDELIRAAQDSNSPILLKPQFTLRWQNTSPQWTILRLDCLDPNLDAATADQVTTLPAYQHLFSEDALRPGMQLGVGHLVFLFSDIRGSTQMYRDLGDSKAFRMVQDHFAVMDKLIRKEGGTIVKTIGDAVMASFLLEPSAIRAAIAIQEHYDNQQKGVAPRLKIALNSGPCIMVNLNDRMDYFGNTLNTCSRLLDLASDEDIVLSEGLFRQPKVQAFLQQQNVTWTEEQQVLRGLQTSQTFYRLKLIRQMPLRLTS